MKSSTSARNEGLDTLRALAIVLVVLHHYVLFVSGKPTFGWVGEVGWIGVDLFFALSGYLIGNQIFKAMRSHEGFSLGRFYARRLLRTLPAFYAVLALYALWPWFRNGQELPPLWKFFSFTQNILLEPGTAFSHAWSLCIEEQFYLLLPAAALLIGSLRSGSLSSGSLRTGSLRASPLQIGWSVIGAAFVIGMLARAALWHHYVDNAGNPRPSSGYFQYIYYASVCRFDELVAGVALALLKNYHQALWRQLTRHGHAALALGVAVTLGACALFIRDRTGLLATVIGFPLLAVGFAFMIIAALSPASLLRHTRVPGAAGLALWAYAIYLTHKQVCILGAAQLKTAGYGPESALTIGVLLTLSVLIGWVLYRCVEAPFMALRDAYVTPTAAPR